MGRSQGFEAQQFADTGLPKKGGRSQVVCRHCLAAYNDHTREKTPPEPKVISGRDTNYTSHLKDYQYFKEAQERGDVTAPLVQPTILHHFLAQSGAKPPSSSASSMSASRSSIGDASSASSAKRSRCICQYFNPVFCKDDHDEFERLLIQF
ncbi:hypothetical protein GN958_ATG02414 [Phytophthora infestans]|uniref:Uncharacterized protein n=1 Tax=Phytophthora infestans TaxID=4787 RepID=A0A8S9V5W5_PHYIN|nr:hypothetical protein GN958_ATG02414 [Phytophthora infestans]